MTELSPLKLYSVSHADDISFATKRLGFTTYSCCQWHRTTTENCTLTLQHLKQIWSRRLFKHINKNLKLLKTLRYICHIILKTLLPKEILLSLSNISFGHNVFKSRLLQWRLYASLGDEELSHTDNCLFGFHQLGGFVGNWCYFACPFSYLF